MPLQLKLGGNEMIKDKLVIEKNYNGTVKTAIRNGFCLYSKKPESYYIENDYLIVTEEEFEAIHEKYLNDICNNWEEITEDQFEDALNVLPPMRWRNGGFYMSERYTGDVSDFYQEKDGKYYTSLQRLSYDRGEIMDNLREYIAI